MKNSRINLAIIGGLTLCAATAQAESFEMVTATQAGDFQFLSDSFAYGPSVDGGAIVMFAEDQSFDVALSSVRERASWVNFLSYEEGIVGSVDVLSDNQQLNLFETKDAGQSWTPLGEFRSYGGPPKIRWYDEDSAYLFGTDVEDSTILTVFHTDDRFQNVEELSFDVGGGDKIDAARNIIPVTKDVLYMGKSFSKDGGKTWTEWDRLEDLGSEDLFFGTENALFRQYNSNSGFATYVSNDEGASWDLVSQPDELTSLASVSFCNDKLGIARVRVGANQNEELVQRTTDGGLTWTTDELPEDLGFLSHVYCVTDEVQYVLGTQGLARSGTPAEVISGDGDSDGGGEMGGASGDGDGDTAGDGDGDTAGDGDGDTAGDGDGDSARSGDGDGSTADGDGDGDESSGCALHPAQRKEGNSGIWLMGFAMWAALALRRRRQT